MSTASPNAEASSSTSYRPPTKYILSQAHLAAFQRSPAHDDMMAFINSLNDSIIDKKLRDKGKGSEATDALLSILDEVERIARSTPPVDNKLSRFGNPAFKTFYDKVSEASHAMHLRIPHLPIDAIPEVSVYFNESWGNKQRVDYGSGMELNFLCWMLCLVKLKVLQQSDYSFIVLGVFWRYIEVMRYLQSTYWLEPAGSHGVWGLDDYHFLPFLWGAGQLRDHKHLKPKAIHDAEVIEAFAPDYMYLSCIAFINSIKSASLRWHSPMLDDISAVKSWAKVNDGMRKMYRAEVLGKLPVMQHALFGSLIKYPVDDPELQDAVDVPNDLDEHGHIHPKSGEGWAMDCCGIPVPSAFAQAQIKGGPGIKPIPFD